MTTNFIHHRPWNAGAPKRQRTTSPTRSPAHHAVAITAIVVLLGSIIAANYVTTDYGFIPVGFGLMATAGTFFAGFALAARDAIQDAWGRWPVVGVILAGTALSFIIAEPVIAVASAVAFLVAELLNFAVYTPLRERAKLGDRRWAVAVASSNVVGAIADTVLFLGIAFGAAAIMPALAGQLVGKTYATVLYLVIGAVGAAWWRRRRAARVEAEVAA